MKNRLGRFEAPSQAQTHEGTRYRHQRRFRRGSFQTKSPGIKTGAFRLSRPDAATAFGPVKEESWPFI
jgi:hypothetical protein